MTAIDKQYRGILMICRRTISSCLVVNVCRLGSFGREHPPVKEKPKKDKDKHKEKTGKDPKSPHGDTVLRSSLSWDSSQG